MINHNRWGNNSRCFCNRGTRDWLVLVYFDDGKSRGTSIAFDIATANVGKPDSVRPTLRGIVEGTTDTEV